MNKILIPRSLVALAVFVTAIIQWLVVLERISAAGWEWYKFRGYAFHGAVTVGVTSQILFYILTLIAVIAGFLAVRPIATGRWDSVQVRTIKAGITALLVGMALWSGMLLSPLITFR